MSDGEKSVLPAGLISYNPKTNDAFFVKLKYQPMTDPGYAFRAMMTRPKMNEPKTL